MQEQFVLDQQFKLSKTLGIGQYAKVKLGRDLRSGQKFAIKIHKEPTTSLELDSILREARLLILLRGHPRIISLESIRNHGCFLNKHNEPQNVIYFTMEHANRGELFKYICHTHQFSENLARTLFMKILEAVEYCHSLGIAHRDIKSENILLTTNFQIKLADLGSAIQSDEDSNLMLFGSEEFNPPEVLSHFDEHGNGNVEYDRVKGDMFSLGVLLFSMVMGLQPFRSARSADPYYQRLWECPEKFWKIFRDYRLTDEFKRLFSGLVHIDPDQRYDMQEVKQSLWLNGKVLGDDELRSEMEPRDKMLRASTLARESPRESLLTVKEPDLDAYRSTFDSKFEELSNALTQCSDD